MKKKNFLLHNLFILISLITILIKSKAEKTNILTDAKTKNTQNLNFLTNQSKQITNEKESNSANKYNYMTLKLAKKANVDKTYNIQPANSSFTSMPQNKSFFSIENSISENYFNKLSQQFFELSDSSKLNIKHLDLSIITSLQKAIAIEPVKIRNYFNMQYYASLFVGEQKQEFSVIIDTGSNLLWLPSSNCTLCRNYTNKYNESLSPTNKLLNKTINITYGKGFVEGDLLSDDVYIAENFGVKNMHFLSVDKELELDGTISDGLLGLGLYFEHNKNFSFIYGLFSQGLINKPAFTFYLTDSSFSNRLYIGDIKENTDLAGFWAQAQSCQVNNSSQIFSKYWACDVLSISTSNQTFEKSNLDFLEDSNNNALNSIYNDNANKFSDNNNNNNFADISSNAENSISSSKINNDNSNNNSNETNNLNTNSAENYQFKTTSKAIFDTGSSLVFIPPNDFLNLIPYFSSKAIDGSCTLSYAFQIHCKCKSPTDFGSIYLNFANNNKFVVDFESIIDYMPSSEFQCRFQIILDLFNFDTWILGDSVLRYSFITFDMEKREVSFLQNSGMITDSNVFGINNGSNANNNGNNAFDGVLANNKDEKWIFRYLVYLVVFFLAALFAYAVYRCFTDKPEEAVYDGNYERLANN